MEQFNLYLKQVLDIVEVVVEVRYVKGDNGGTFLWISSIEKSASIYTNQNIRNRELSTCQVLCIHIQVNNH